MNRDFLIATLALLACSADVSTTSFDHKPVAHTVVIEGMQFKPATLTIGPPAADNHGGWLGDSTCIDMKHMSRRGVLPQFRASCSMPVRSSQPPTAVTSRA